MYITSPTASVSKVDHVLGNLETGLDFSDNFSLSLLGDRYSGDEDEGIEDMMCGNKIHDAKNEAFTSVTKTNKIDILDDKTGTFLSQDLPTAQGINASNCPVIRESARTNIILKPNSQNYKESPNITKEKPKIVSCIHIPAISSSNIHNKENILLPKSTQTKEQHCFSKYLQKWVTLQQHQKPQII